MIKLTELIEGFNITKIEICQIDEIDVPHFWARCRNIKNRGKSRSEVFYFEEVSDYDLDRVEKGSYFWLIKMIHKSKSIRAEAIYFEEQ